MAGIEPVINEKQLQKSISKKSRPLDAKYFDCIKTIKVVKYAFKQPNEGNNYLKKHLIAK